MRDHSCMTGTVYALNCGTLEFERRSFFPDAERGIGMRVPVPAFLVTHPRGKVLFDTGIHAEGFSDPVAHFGKDLAAYFKFSCGAEMRATRAARDADRRPDRDWDGPLDYRLLEGEHDLFGDGKLVIVPTPGHTAGHQSLRVEAGSGMRLCLTGDACYTQEHLERDLLPSTGAVFNAGDMRHSLGLLRRMRDREGLALVYGHDAAQLREIRAAPEAFA